MRFVPRRLALAEAQRARKALGDEGRSQPVRRVMRTASKTVRERQRERPRLKTRRLESATSASAGINVGLKRLVSNCAILRLFSE
jgi:hypothetical protein